MATGECIGFVDPDDWAKPNMFERLYELIQEKNADIVMCDTFLYDDQAQQDKSVEWTLRSELVQKDVFSYRDLHYEANGDVGDIINDCRDSLKYIATNFPFLDEKNILLMGDSAGAHLALCLCMNLPDNINPAIKPNKIAAYNPVTDCVNEKWSYCSYDSIKYSPLHNIKHIDAEILLLHGTADTIVNIEDSRTFTEKMKAIGNNISMIEIPDARHAFILFGYTAEENDVLNALNITDKYLNL